jgi:hypothetical protein
VRKLAGTLLAVAIAVAGVIGLIAFFNARDDSTAGDQTKTERAAATGDGNVVVTFRDPADGRRLRALAEELGAPDTPELRAAGLAVVVEKGDAITATAGDETVTVGSVGDPALQDFIERWLGQGSSG